MAVLKKFRNMSKIERALYVFSVIFFIVSYGQNFLDKGTMPRKMLFFCGDNALMLLLGICISVLIKKGIAIYIITLVTGSLINSVFYQGDLDFYEVIFAIIGLPFVIYEEGVKTKYLKIKQWIYKKLKMPY